MPTVSCPKCSAPQKSRDVLLQHLRQSRTCSDDPDRFRCLRCRKGFPAPYALSEHIRRPKACLIQQRRQQVDEMLARSQGEPDASAEETKLGEGPQSLECPKCRQSCASRTRLLKHLAISSSCGDRSYDFACAECGAAFCLQSQLTIHLRGPKASAMRIKKAQLGKLIGAPQSKDPEKCSQSTVPRKPAQCPKCRKSYASKTILVQHMDISLSCGDRTYDFACADCGAAYRLQSQLSAHARRLNACAMRLKQEEIRRLIEQPQAENVVAEAPLGLQTEEKKVAEKKARAPFISETCAKCGKSFNSRGALLKHVSLSKSCGDRKDGFACPRCGAAFSLASELARHLRGTRGCHIRLKQQELLSRLKDAPELKSAAIQLDEASSDGSNSCGKCGKTYASKTVLRQHLADSTSCGEREARFVCPRCGAVFPLPCDLARHMAAPKACSIRLKRKLLDSLAVDAKNLKCLKCERSFDKMDRLRRHVEQSKSCGGVGKLSKPGPGEATEPAQAGEIR